ncbi:hypothetical protein QYH69_29515 [Paraburkholderia sp. SARCC-3016]|uniref:ParB/RepB/Spo0J family partition protein n=1 Tax=Paraburkholderia sp. SARCC-3016 TaxID=3058611 RepID=UPI002807954B|nr:hypothetical protein [Paraburkholderia sp. SARCC-3016]MDQ7981375.1 hypothetical protein [Paraburkholderia sp. SARCC-3016]
MNKTRSLPLDEPIVTGNTKAAVKAAGGKSADLWMLPFDKIHFDPRDNVRPLDTAWAKHLAQLIQSNGYDKSQPLHCYIRKVNGEDLVYLWKGQHRYHGTRIAIDNGFDPGLIPVVIADAKTVDRVNLIFGGLTSNDSKANSPLDLAEKIIELREQHGIDNATICKRLEITDQTIRDVLLLASGPFELHKLVRAGTISSTLAIQQIRQHGAGKALDRIARGIEQAQADGRTKVTKKHVEKAAAPKAQKITDTQAKQLLQALQSVLHDPVFGKLSPGTIAGVHAALSPHADLLDAVPAKRSKYRISKPNAHGVYADHDTIKAPLFKRSGKHPYEIHLAQVAAGKWIFSTSYSIGTGSGSSPCTLRDNAPTHPTRGQAIRAAVKQITREMEDPRKRDAKEAPGVHAWLNKLWQAPDPDWTEDLAKEPVQ